MATTGHITVASAGTAVAGPDEKNDDGFLLRVYTAGESGWFFDNDGSATKADDGVEIDSFGWSYTAVTNLNDLKFDAETNGDEIGWVKA